MSFTSIGAVLISPWRHRRLLAMLIERDVLLRYRGAMFGIAWMFLSPLTLVAIYAYVFGHVMRGQWQQTINLPYWVPLFAGMLAFNLFADALSRAPQSVRTFPSFVKKIAFPVEILPMVPVGAALVHLIFNTTILLVVLAWFGTWSLQLLLIPFALFPLLLMALGCAWFLGAWGVFIKDWTQIVPVLLQVLLFSSPVFYASDAVTGTMAQVLALNPLTPSLEMMRAVISDDAVDWKAWVQACGIGLLMATAGATVFEYSRDEFSDAL